MSKDTAKIESTEPQKESLNPEVELLKRKLAEKEALIASFMQTETHLVPLPNGDLHRGFRNGHGKAQANIEVDVIPDDMGNPLDRAMAKILNAAKGGHQLTCLWCGIQFGANSEKDIREHLRTSHPSVVEGWEKQENAILMQNLQEAQARLAAAEA